MPFSHATASSAAAKRIPIKGAMFSSPPSVWVLISRPSSVAGPPSRVHWERDWLGLHAAQVVEDLLHGAADRGPEGAPPDVPVLQERLEGRAPPVFPAEVALQAGGPRGPPGAPLAWRRAPGGPGLAL